MSEMWSPDKGSLSGHTRFVHFWQRMTARALTVEVTYWHGDDDRKSSRYVELEVPKLVWRPQCWVRGHVEGPDYDCIYCGKLLHPRIVDG